MKTATLLVLCVCVAAMQRPVPSRPTPLVRFHHVHYRVSDPGAALAPAVERLRGARVLLPGLGVGVRVGREYLLFDRDDAEQHTAHVPAADESDVVQWLMAHGVEVEPRQTAGLNVEAGLPPDAVRDHIAFAANDLDAVLATVKERPLSKTESAARFRLPSGGIFEIVRDTIGPDAYWCPMHPDVRRPDAVKCPICGMPLVSIPPPRLGEYRLDVTLTPRPGGGASGLILTLRDPEAPNAAPALIEVHERPLHLFIVSRDLETFAHVHPERQRNGSFAIRHTLAPGAYAVMADFLPANGTSQLLQRVVVTPGYAGSLFTPPALTPGSTEQTANGLAITLDPGGLKPRRASTLRFHVVDATTKRPAMDLEPYLGAAAHLIVVSADLTAAFHAHPDTVLGGGSTVMFDPMFPAPGLYKMWVQFQRKGQVVTAPFVVTVP